MKNIFLFLFFAGISTLSTFAQTPQYIPYQAVARNAAGNLLVNQNVSLRFTIHETSGSGTVDYQETQSATTNNLGLFTVNIGNGTRITGTLSGVPWGNGTPKFTQVEIDPTGGSSYTDMGASQMQSVPYALYAGNASSVPLTSGTGISVSGDQISNTGVVSLTTSGSNGAASLSGTTLNVPDYTLSGLGGIGLSALSASSPLAYNSGTGAFSVSQANTSTNGYLSSTDWNTFNNKQGAISLTTNNSSGSATFSSNTLNIPNYTLAGLGGQAALTSANAGTGISISGGVISNTGVISLANPTGSIGMTANNGSATTAMRSDATPAINAAIAPAWTGTHTFSNGTYSALFTGGNVGIGTSSPVNKLQVEGNLHMDGHPIYFRSGPSDNYDFVQWGGISGGSGNDRVDIAGYNGVDLGYSSGGTGIATVLSIAGSLVNIPGLSANSEVFTDGSSNLTTTPPTGGLSWSTKGNTGTTPTGYSDAAAQTNNFIGTTDNQSVNIYTNASSATAKSNLTLVTSTSTGAAIATPADILQIRRNGTNSVNYPGVASFALGKYAADITSESVLAIKLGNGGVSTPDVTVMTMQGNGAVGIGTTSPGSNLLNVSSSTASGFGINLAGETGASNGNGGGVSISAGAGNGAANGGSVTIASGANGSSSNGGSSGSVNITGANAGASSYGVGGGSVNISAGSAYNAGGSGIGGSVNITAGGNTLGSNSYGNINFYTYANSGTSTSEAMFISGSNNDIGIGTASPTQTLSVNGSQGIWNSNELSFYTDNGATQHGFVGEYSASSDMSIAAVTSGNWLRLGSNNANIAFFPNGGINSGGNPLDYISSTGTFVASQLQVGTSNSSGGTNGTTINHMEAGLTNIGTNSGGVKTVTVTLNFPSGVTPNMICTVVSQPGTNYSDTYVAHVRSISNGSATVNIYRVDTSGGWGQSPNLSWIAWY